MDNGKAVEKIKCGLIMPISSIDGCTMEHWGDVKSILIEATGSIENYDVKTTVVSEADDVGIIQKRIVQNIYNADIVICDVSCKNPNVMFELGMRLAFDKPTIIVKDDKTNYTFDTGVIEHLEYPRDLRFTKIVEFKMLLAKKIVSTIAESRMNPEFSTFLKSFGTFKTVSLKEKEVSIDKAVLDGIEELRSEILSLKRNTNYNKDKMLSYNEKHNFSEAFVIKAKTKIHEYAKANKIKNIWELDSKNLYDNLYNALFIDGEGMFMSKARYNDFYRYLLDLLDDVELC